jgi:lipocalin-like protein
MDLKQEPKKNEPSSKSPRSKRRWLIGISVLVGVATIAWQVRQRENEGQWLIGRWTNIQTYSEESKVEREWIFKADGRVTGTNHYVLTGTVPKATTQTFAGKWTVRENSLHIKFDRSSIRDLVLMGSRAYTAIYNAVTRQSLKVIDAESSDGEIVLDTPDQFTVQWLDPSSPTPGMTPQTWTRIP